MALVVGTNSYLDAAEADTYFSTRYGADAWDAQSPTQKESALVSATPLLDNFCVWSGEKTDPAQALAFPRDGDTEVPQTIKDVQCELAFNVINAGGIDNTAAAALQRLKADTVEIQWMENYAKTYSIYTGYISTLLTPYCDPSASGSNGCARVIRT